MHCTWELLKKKQKKNTVHSKTQEAYTHTFLNPALEINSLSFYHTNNTFLQHCTTKLLILMQWCIFARRKRLCQERPDFDNAF